MAAVRGPLMVTNGDRDAVEGRSLVPVHPWIEMIWTGHCDPPFPRKCYVILWGFLQHVSFFLSFVLLCPYAYVFFFFCVCLMFVCCYLPTFLCQEIKGSQSLMGEMRLIKLRPRGHGGDVVLSERFHKHAHIIKTELHQFWFSVRVFLAHIPRNTVSIIRYIPVIYMTALLKYWRVGEVDVFLKDGGFLFSV